LAHKNDIFHLLDALDRRKFLRISDADPTIPPRIPVKVLKDVGIDPEGNEVREVDLGQILKPIVKNPKEGSEELLDIGIIQTYEFPIDEKFNWEIDEILDNLDRIPLDHIPGDRGRKSEGDGNTYDEVDVFAWYCPFHYYGVDYGIYISKIGIHKIAKRIASFLPPLHGISRLEKNILRDQLKQAAFFYFFIHEHYHHKVESFCTRLELIENQARFIPQSDSVYDRTFLTDENLEECLANGEIIRRLKLESPYKNIFGNWWGKMYGFNLAEKVISYARSHFEHRAAEGYRRAMDFTGPRHGFQKILFEERQFLHFSQLQSATLNPLQTDSDWRWERELASPLYDKNIVAYEVLDGSRSSTLPAFAKPLVQVSPRNAMRRAGKWGLKPIKKKSRTSGDHQWFENERGNKDHVDTGGHAMSRRDWEALLGLVNKSWNTEFEVNVDGIKSYLAGPRRLGLPSN